MSITFRNYNFDAQPVTALTVDTNEVDTFPNVKYVWYAFEKNFDEKVVLQKVSINDLTQLYTHMEPAVDRINDLIVSNGYLFMAVQHDTWMGQKISVETPLTSQSAITRPIGINEHPIQVVAKGNFLYYLFPGVASGENAKIVRVYYLNLATVIYDFAKSGEIITNAKSMTVDDDYNIWIVTDTDPTMLVRYMNGAGTFEVTNITQF